MTKLFVETEVETEYLPEALAHHPNLTRRNYYGLIDFVLQLDANVDDIQFTIALRDRLNQVIEEASE